MADEIAPVRRPAAYSSSQRLIVVSHTEEGENFRIISAREANSHERKKYES
ncbi:MAG: BrnT family toxin [Betaproteobacteria bacterium]|nr:BrnT family toxin [Betaproteobacteria bacterium]